MQNVNSKLKTGLILIFEQDKDTQYQREVLGSC